MASATIQVECPVCEEEFELELDITPGVEESGYGPPENYDPGYGPEVELSGNAPKACPECKTVWTPEQKDEVDISIEKAIEKFDTSSYMIDPHARRQRYPDESDD